MLVLKRTMDERVTVLDKNHNKLIEIVVVQTQRGHVKLGFKADKEQFDIFRNELLEKDAAAKEAA